MLSLQYLLLRWFDQSIFSLCLTGLTKAILICDTFSIPLRMYAKIGATHKPQLNFPLWMWRISWKCLRSLLHEPIYKHRQYPSLGHYSLSLPIQNSDKGFYWRLIYTSKGGVGALSKLVFNCENMAVRKQALTHRYKMRVTP